jgi:3-oxoacyl-[acyl-carrier protein] reductase
VRTPMVEQAIRDGILIEEELVDRMPIGRLAEPEDVARAVALVASRRAVLVTGSVLVVDGGYSTYGAAHPVSRLLPPQR